MREEGKQVETGLKIQRLGKTLDYANQSNISKVVIFGEDEKLQGIYKVKNMSTGKEHKISFK